MTRSSNLTLPRVLVILGMVVGAISVSQTIAHAFDDAYLIAGLDDGEEHAQYHMARETWLTIGAYAIVLIALFAPAAARTRTLWLTMLAATVGYVLAMWSGGYTAGEWAPDTPPLIIHAVASVLLLAGVTIARRAYGQPGQGAPPG
jgi:hypothetical protein